MRLVFFGPGHPFRGGIARTTTEAVRSLADHGHDVLFLTPKRQYPQWLYPGASDRDTSACPELECARAVIDPLNPVAWPQARRAAATYGADAWILPYWTWAWAGLWRFLFTDSGRPATVAVVHNPADHDARLWQRLAAKSVLGRCQGLFTHARVLAAQLERDYPHIPRSHYPLPSVGRPAALERRAARRKIGVDENRRVALFVGFIRPYKGVDLLLEAAALLPPESDWLVLVAGEPWGDLGEALERRAAAADLEARVRLDLGWVAEDRLPVLLAAADLLVLPYRSGSQSAMAPMGLAHGVPVLSTDVGGVPEIVADGVNGRIVPPGDATAIATALDSLDRERLRALAAGAVRSAARLSWSSYVEELEELIASVV